MSGSGPGAGSGAQKAFHNVAVFSPALFLGLSSLSEQDTYFLLTVVM